MSAREKEEEKEDKEDKEEEKEEEEEAAAINREPLFPPEKHGW